MSKFLDKSDAIKDRLELLPELDGVDVLVNRRKDVDSDFKTAMARTKGAAVIIFWEGGRNINSKATAIRLEATYIISVIAKPVLRGGESSADLMIQAICKSLNGWNESETHCNRQMRVDSIRPIADPRFSIHAITTKTNIDL